MKRRYVYLRPFSHLMGASCLIPNSCYVVQAFASKIFIFDLESRALIKEFDIPTHGLVKNFTLTQDLEGGFVSCHSDSFQFFITKELEISTRRVLQPLKQERLCFGVYKKQEVESIKRRALMQEILPFLFRLGNQITREPTKERASVFSLLEQCREEEKPERIEKAFQKLYHAGFTPFFIPQKSDPLLQNLYNEEPLTSSILSLVSETAAWIRSLFFLSGANYLHFLPRNPPECVFGKFFSLETTWGLVDFEWSKKELFTVRIQVTKSGVVELRLPSSIKRYRLREGKRQRLVEKGEGLELCQGTSLVLDRFEK